jgi:hypothetical protein
LTQVAIDLIDTGPPDGRQHQGASRGVNRAALGMWLMWHTR